MTDKPFKTIKQQLEILEKERHLTILDPELADRVLRRYGYYEIINGYKTPFLIEPGNDEKGYKTDATNLTDKDLDPTSAWMAVFTAIQDNDKNSINELEVASLPDDQYLDSQTETIKKNGTVSNAVAYTLSDTTTPVQLKASKGVDGKVLGTKTYKIVENN